MNFQPLGVSGDELSDCKRYFIARMWRPRDHWEVWLQASDGPNTLLDSLVKERFLLDDSPDHVTVEYVQDIGEPHTTISIEEAVA